MPVLQYFARKQVGSLPGPEATLSNARVRTGFRCFGGNWHLIEVIAREDLIVTKDTMHGGWCRFVLFSWLILSATRARYTIYIKNSNA